MFLPFLCKSGMICVESISLHIGNDSKGKSYVTVGGFGNVEDAEKVIESLSEHTIESYNTNVHTNLNADVCVHVI